MCACHSPCLVDVCPLAGGAGGGRLGERARVQDPLGPSVHSGLGRQRQRQGLRDRRQEEKRDGETGDRRRRGRQEEKREQEYKNRGMKIAMKSSM